MRWLALFGMVLSTTMGCQGLSKAKVIELCRANPTDPRCIAVCQAHPTDCAPFLGGQSGSTGGAVGSGGIVASGGIVGTGGTVATGGSVETGGAVTTGGVIGTGGLLTTGGVVGSGGAVAVGGTMAGVPDAGPGCIPIPGYLLVDNGCGGPYITNDPSKTVVIGGFVKGETSSRVYGVLALDPQLALAPTTPDAVLGWTIGNDCVAAKACLDQALMTANGCASVIQLSDADIAAANIVAYQLPYRPGSVYLTDPSGNSYVLQQFNLVFKFQTQLLIPAALTASLFPDNALVRQRTISASDFGNTNVYKPFAPITDPTTYQPDSTCNAGAGNLVFIFGNLPH